MVTITIFAKQSSPNNTPKSLKDMPSLSSTFLYDKMYYVYIAKNSINKLYVGVTENPQSRVYIYNQKRGAKFTKYVPDFKIIFLEEYSNLVEARRREIQIKKWRRDKKELLIQRYQSGLPTKL